jgi:tetratricopeptide (TPR) repeat protein
LELYEEQREETDPLVIFKEMRALAQALTATKKSPSCPRAKELYLRCYELSSVVFESKSPERLSLLDEVGRLLIHHRESYELCGQILEECHSSSCDIFGHTALQTLETRTQLAKYYSKEKKTATRALSLYEECLSLYRQACGHRHPLTFQSLLTLNQFTDQQNLNHLQQRLFYEEALELCYELFPREGEDQGQTLLICLDHLIDYHSHHEEYSLAIFYSETFLSIHRDLYGSSHDTILAINNLATLYDLSGHPDLQLVASLYSECLVLSREVLGETHSHTLIALHTLGHFHLTQKNYPTAEALLVECVALCREVFGERDSQTVEVMETLESYYRSQGDERNLNLLRGGPL